LTGPAFVLALFLFPCAQSRRDLSPRQAKLS
jgi:hypothetical protein